VKGLLALYLQGLEADDETGNSQLLQERVSPQLLECVICPVFRSFYADFSGKH